MAFFDIMRANDVYDVIYDVTVENVKHASLTFFAKYSYISFLRYKRKLDERFYSIELLKCPYHNFELTISPLFPWARSIVCLMAPRNDRICSSKVVVIGSIQITKKSLYNSDRDICC